MLNLAKSISIAGYVFLLFVSQIEDGHARFMSFEIGRYELGHYGVTEEKLKDPASVKFYQDKCRKEGCKGNSTKDVPLAYVGIQYVAPQPGQIAINCNCQVLPKKRR